MSKLSIAPQDLSHKEMGKTTEEANECSPCKFSIESGEVSHEKLGQMAEKANSEGKFSIEFPDGDASHEKLYRIMKKLQEFSKESGVEFRNFKIFSRREGEDSTEEKLDEDRTDDFNKTFEKTEALQEKPPTESKGENKRKREPEPEPQSRTKFVKEENNPTAA